MPPVGVDRAEHHVVLQDQGAVERTGVEVDGPAAAGDPGQADDPGGRDLVHRFEDDRRCAGALDDDVRFEIELVDRAGVVGGAERARQRRLRPVGGQVEHVYGETALTGQQGGQQADRAGSGDQRRTRLPLRPLPDAEDVVPRLDHHARRFEQHTHLAQSRVQPDGEARLESPALPSEAGQRLDAMLGEHAVAAHVPLVDRAVRAGHRIRMADDPGHQFAGLQRAGRVLDHPAQRLVPEHQMIRAGWGLAVFALDDFEVRAADPHRDRLHQDRTLLRGRLRVVVEQPQRAGYPWNDSHSAHAPILVRSRRTPPEKPGLPPGCVPCPVVHVAPGQRGRPGAAIGSAA